MANSTIKSKAYGDLADIDLNDIKNDYVGYVSRASNTPTTNGDGYLIVIGNDENDRCTQYWKVKNNTTTYHRYFISDSWADWYALVTAYRGGSTFNITGGYNAFVGYITSSGKAIRFNIPLNRPYTNASSVSCSFLKCTIRHADGGYIFDNVDIYNGSTYDSLVNSLNCRLTNTGIYVEINLKNATSFINNSVLVVSVITGNFTFV